MQFEIGKIINFDNYVGEIMSLSGDKHIFLCQDLREAYEDLKDKTIIFRPEEINNEKRAFYVQKLENILNDKSNIKEIVLKIKKNIDN